MADPWLPDDPPWDRDDAAIEAALARTRERRGRAALFMVLLLVVPLAAQAVLVSLGAASRWGVMVIALPAMVAWILLRGRTRR
jgi:hypothetical protein